MHRILWVRKTEVLTLFSRTWILTLEPVLEPPRVLAEEAKKAGLADDAFTVCGLGETVIVAN